MVDAQQRSKSHMERLESIQEELRKREAEVCDPSIRHVTIFLTIHLVGAGESSEEESIVIVA